MLEVCRPFNIVAVHIVVAMGDTKERHTIAKELDIAAKVLGTEVGSMMVLELGLLDFGIEELRAFDT